MTRLERIALTSTCLWLTATLAGAQGLGGQNLPRLEPLKGTLGELPDSHPHKCREVTEVVDIHDDDDHVRSKAWEILHEKGYNEYDFRTQIANQMKGTEYFDLQRLEVTGIFTGADAEEPFSNRFDRHLHPSNLAEFYETVVKSSFIPSKLLREEYYSKELEIKAIEDVAEARVEMNGDLTKRGADILNNVKGLYINEIVAHSWGSDIVYNGILEGYINPPKRVILIGVPSPYVTKWTELAKRLDVEVNIYSNENDIVRKASEKWWEPRNAAGFDDPPVYSQRVWTEKVDAYCEREGAICESPDIKGDIPIQTHMNVQLVSADRFGHGRAAYYDYIAAHGELSETPDEMRQRQEDAVSSEMNREFGAAMEEAREVLRNSLYKSVTRQVCTDYTEEDFRHDAPVAAAPVAVPYRPLYNPYDELYALATVACQNPDALTIDEMRRHLSGFPDGQQLVPNGNIPTGCLQGLFSQLLQFNASWPRNTALSRDWLVFEAKRLIQAYAPPLPIQPSNADSYKPSSSYSGWCGTGGSLCGSNQPHLK